MVRRLDSVTAEEWRARRAASSGPRQVAGPLLDLLRTSAALKIFDADHLTHQLQTATRAYRAGADDELVVAALFHDVAELTAGPAHGKVAAELLRGDVRRRPLGPDEGGPAELLLGQVRLVRQGRQPEVHHLE